MSKKPTSRDFGAIVERLYEIALADPADIIRSRRVNCRYCRGTGHRYQLTTEEYAYEVLCKSNPDINVSGGDGFDPTLAPIPECPSCHGEGVVIVELQDTRDIPTRSKWLYDGVKQTKDGIQVNLVDRIRAIATLAAILGYTKEAFIPVSGDSKIELPPASKDEMREIVRKAIDDEGI